MRTPPLRRRVALVTLAVLALAFSGGGVAVTLAYRDGLSGDLRARLLSGARALAGGAPGQLKPLIQSLVLEGIDVRVTSSRPLSKPGGPSRPAPRKPPAIRSDGSLLVVREPLTGQDRPGTATLSASTKNIGASVGRLITVELIASLAALAIAALVLMRGLRAALEPLGHVARTAAKIAARDRTQRLRPTSPDSELGRMAASFDAMVDALDSAVSRAQASERAMRRFVADASHELRTPIAALQATAETLLREQPERPDRDALEAQLAREAARLGRLSDDLLSLARLEAHEPVERTPLELADLATIVVTETRRRAPLATITLALDASATLRGDADALARALRNLLDNALEATARAGAIEVRLERDAQDALLRVTDDGPGVPEHDRERIFDGFVRLGPGRSGGAGLGLAIARRVARQHGGDLLCVASARGACFLLRLPREPAPPAPASSRPPTLVATAGAGGGGPAGAGIVDLRGGQDIE